MEKIKYGALYCVAFLKDSIFILLNIICTLLINILNIALYFVAMGFYLLRFVSHFYLFFFIVGCWYLYFAHGNMEYFVKGEHTILITAIKTLVVATYSFGGWKIVVRWIGLIIEFTKTIPFFDETKNRNKLNNKQANILENQEVILTEEVY